jgi:hypothetical protein
LGRIALLLTAPVLAGLVARAFGAEGPAGRFQAGLAALLAAASLGAFVARGPRDVAALAGACALAAPFAWIGGATGGQGLALAALCAAAAGAAGGVASLGRALGARDPGPGAVALAVLATSACGAFWAERVAERLPVVERPLVRQALLHADLATALAYGAAGHDRLREPGIYESVPLASSTVEVPRAGPTALLWAGVALAALLAARAVGAASPRGEAG